MKSQKKLVERRRGVLISAAVLASILIVIFVMFLKINQPQKQASTLEPQQDSDAKRFAAEYNSTSADNPFIYTSGEDTLSIFNEGTGLVYLGFPACPWCQSLVGLIEQAAKKEALDKVYYLDIRQERQSGSATYKQLVVKLKDYLDHDEAGEPIIYVPDVTAVKNGKIVGRFEMEKASEQEQSGGQAGYWTEARKQRTIESLQQLIQKIR